MTRPPFLHESLRGLPVEGSAGHASVSINGRTIDRGGSGWRAASLVLIGPRGSFLGTIDYTAAELRELASIAVATAEALDLADGRTCACHAADHRFPGTIRREAGAVPVLRCYAEPAPGEAYCRDCWTPEYGSRHGLRSADLTSAWSRMDPIPPKEEDPE